MRPTRIHRIAIKGSSGKLAGFAGALRRRWARTTSRLPLADDYWSYSRPAHAGSLTQGWKLHVSATILSAHEVFARVRPILRAHKTAFKVPTTLEFLSLLNSGNMGFSQVGKFLTIYPTSSEEALILARELHAATRDLRGPEVPYDLRYRANSLVYYRFGSLTSDPGRSADVLFDPAGRPQPEKRAPGCAVPPWVDDPFSRSRKAARPSADGPIGCDLLPYRAITQRGKGGCYEAIDLSVSPARLVILKEGRPDGETDWSGGDGYSRLKHEGWVLRELAAHSLPVPAVYREFAQDRKRYLVLERIEGSSLLLRHRVQPTRSSWRQAASILAEIEPLLEKIHHAGLVWRDCKPAHIFRHRGVIRLIDFEGACRIAETEVAHWGSYQYLPPIYADGSATRRPGTLEDNYALGVIAFQFLAAEFPSSNARARSKVYRRTNCPDPLRERIERLLRC